MIEQKQEVFWLTSADHQRLLYVSPTFEALWGHPLERLYSYPGGYLSLIKDSIHPSDRERVVAALAQQEQDEYKIEYRIVRPDGSIRWVRSRSFPIRNELGEPWGIAGLSEDISAPKQTETILYQREHEFRALVENSPDIITRFDRHLRHVYINPVVEQLTGISPQAFIGKTHEELGMPQELLSVWVPSLQKIFQTGQPDEYEFSYLTPTGRKYYQSRLVPEFAADGSVESVLAICRDITENKQTQLELQSARDELEKRVAERTAELAQANALLQQEIAERKLAQEALKSQKDFLQTVLDANPNLIWVKDTEDRTLLANHALADFFETTVEDLFNKTNFDLHDNPADAQQCIAQDREVIATAQEKFIPEEAFPTPSGKVRWFQTIKAPIFGSDGQVAQVLGVSTDITERKLAQEALATQKEFLQAVLDTNPNLIFVKDREGKYLLANRALADFYGVAVEDVLGHTDTELHPNVDEAKQFDTQDKEVLTTLRSQFIPEQAVHTPTGELRWYQTIKKPLFFKHGQDCQLFCVCIDITARKQAEEQLRQSQQQLHLALEAARMGVWNWDIHTGKITWSSSLERLFGFAPNTFNGGFETFMARVHSEDIEYVNQATTHCLNTGEESDVEFRIVLPDGKIRWMQSKGQVFYGSTGIPARAVGINLDITERKQAESRIKESLREKEVLLQEIHHRVKNNLQVISSLLDLQSQYITDPSMLAVFQESQNRVKSMALIHEQLYQSQNCAKINFSDYIEQLTNFLLQAYGLQRDKITAKLDIEEVNLDINTAIPCGLIINELVSNAIKYAFPNQEEGVIQVILHSDSNGKLTLTIKDNGIGFPVNFDLRSVKSLGLQLVNVLINQLEGTLELNRQFGTEFKIQFSELNP